jgi:hypothetical protein
MPKEAHATEFVELSWERRKRQEHGAHFGKREGGESMELILGRVKSHLFSLLVFIAPKSVLECLGTGPRLSLSPFYVILNWFLFSFSSRIGQSNTNFC